MNNIKTLNQDEIRWEQFPDRFHTSKLRICLALAPLLFIAFLSMRSIPETITDGQVTDWPALLAYSAFILMAIIGVVAFFATLCMKRLSLPRHALGNEGMLRAQRMQYHFIPWSVIRDVEPYAMKVKHTPMRYMRILWKDEQHNNTPTQLMNSHSMIMMQSKKEQQRTIERAKFYLQKKTQ